MASLGTFDYLHEPKFDAQRMQVDMQSHRLVFAGNIGGKQQFPYGLDTLDKANYHVDLCCVEFKPEKVHTARRLKAKLKKGGFLAEALAKAEK